MVDVRYSPATEADCEALAAVMRLGDRAECEALGFTPLQGLLESLRVSDVATAVRFDGQVAVVCGLAPIGRPTALGRPYAHVAWALTGAVVDAHPLAFFRASKRMLVEMRRLSPLLVAHVDARYTRAVRWLKALGFVLHEAVAMPPSGLPFYPVSFPVEV